MANKTEPVPGTSDIFPDEIGEWQFLENEAYKTFSKYGYGEIRSPIFERTDVFLRSIGDDTDIVQKEMYTFTDRGNRSLTLRPEGTAGVLRALTNSGLSQGDEKRVYYCGPMFRGERPAAGRRRQFHQIGAECVGKVAPAIDAECMIMLVDYLAAIGINDIQLLINTRGTAEDRQHVSSTYLNYFTPHIANMCSDCQRRLTSNVWRILDCKNDNCRQFIATAPSMIDLLGESNRVYFQDVCDILKHAGVNYKIDSRLVRGLDYYAHTVFEVVYSKIGAQDSIAGGGRYELHLPGVKNTVQGIGFAVGVERLIMAREIQDLSIRGNANEDVYLVSLGDPALKENIVLAGKLRKQGYRVLMDLENRGMKAQMRSANKTGAKVTLIRGEDELKSGVIVCKNMAESIQTEISISGILDELHDIFVNLNP